MSIDNEFSVYRQPKLRTHIVSGAEGIGRYRFSRELGSGLSGTVFLASEEAGESAVKVLHGADPIAEAETHKAVTEAGLPNTVPYKEHGIARLRTRGEGPEYPYLVMSYAPGGSLASVRKEVRLGVEDSIDVSGQVAEAVTALNNNGLVHRDVKPANIYFATPFPTDPDSPVPQVWIGDFGATILATDDVGDIITYTSGYTAPEVYDGEVTPAADVYSLGAVFGELVAERPILPLDEAQYENIVQSPDFGLELQVRTMIDVPEHLQTPIRRAMAQFPEDRYDSAEAFMADVQMRHAQAEADKLKPKSAIIDLV